MNNYKSVVWENIGGTIKVSLEDCFDGRRIYVSQKNSNKVQIFSIEEAHAIYNAFVYFINSGELKHGVDYAK